MPRVSPERTAAECAGDGSRSPEQCGSGRVTRLEARIRTSLAGCAQTAPGNEEPRRGTPEASMPSAGQRSIKIRLRSEPKNMFHFNNQILHL